MDANPINLILQTVDFEFRRRIPQITNIEVSGLTASSQIGTHGQFCGRLHVMGTLSGMIAISLGQGAAVQIAERLTGESFVESLSEKAQTAVQEAIQDILQQVLYKLKENHFSVDGTVLPVEMDTPTVLNLEGNAPTLKVTVKLQVTNDLLVSQKKNIPIVRKSSHTSFQPFDLFFAFSHPNVPLKPAQTK